MMVSSGCLCDSEDARLELLLLPLELEPGWGTGSDWELPERALRRRADSEGMASEAALLVAVFVDQSGALDRWSSTSAS